ncbi:hypothetical protein K438DRAFT_1032554 [Mycena galopus ATCC 62051]|nr:hypothetical protein K438DRAFT_1032554 [Mycena galopus ATCC 62051]
MSMSSDISLSSSHAARAGASPGGLRPWFLYLVFGSKNCCTRPCGYIVELMHMLRVADNMTELHLNLDRSSVQS